MKPAVIALLLSLLLTGCASVAMKPVESNALQAAPDGLARVVFIRSSVVAEVSSLALVDVTSGEPEFIGILNNNTRIAFDVAPGKRTFMVVADTVDFLNADLSSDLTYYSLVEPTVGSWKAYFSIWPIRRDSEDVYSVESDDFRTWMRESRWVEVNEPSREWFEENRSEVIAQYQKYWPEWNTQATLDIERQSLRPEDGY